MAASISRTDALFEIVNPPNKRGKVDPSVGPDLEGMSGRVEEAAAKNPIYKCSRCGREFKQEFNSRRHFFCVSPHGRQKFYLKAVFDQASVLHDILAKGK